MKKSYNPFKMWGTGLGSILGVIILSVTLFLAYFRMYQYSFVANGYTTLLVQWLMNWSKTPWDGFLYTIIIGIILGFLLGWGIHSLVRALRK